MASNQPHAEPLLRPDQVAEMLGVKVSTLVRWRSLKQGPPFIRLGHRTVRYQPEALEAWRRSRVNRPLVALPPSE